MLLGAPVHFLSPYVNWAFLWKDLERPPTRFFLWIDYFDAVKYWPDGFFKVFHEFQDNSGSSTHACISCLVLYYLYRIGVSASPDILLYSEIGDLWIGRDLVVALTHPEVSCRIHEMDNLTLSETWVWTNLVRQNMDRQWFCLLWTIAKLVLRGLKWKELDQLTLI